MSQMRIQPVTWQGSKIAYHSTYTSVHIECVFGYLLFLWDFTVIHIRMWCFWGVAWHQLVKIHWLLGCLVIIVQDSGLEKNLEHRWCNQQDVLKHQWIVTSWHCARAQMHLIMLFDIRMVFSSSLRATTSVFDCFGPLNIWFPLITILCAANPILYIQFLHVTSYVTFPSVLWSPMWSYWHRFPLIHFFTILSSGIRCKWPNQLNHCAFMWFIIFLCLINSPNSSFVLILHVPSLSFVEPKVFLNTFLSNTINLFLYGFFQDPHFTAMCYCWSYNTPVVSILMNGTLISVFSHTQNLPESWLCSVFVLRLAVLYGLSFVMLRLTVVFILSATLISTPSSYFHISICRHLQHNMCSSWLLPLGLSNKGIAGNLACILKNWK